MPIATLFTEKGSSRSFEVEVCPIHVMYQGKLWARQQGGDWEKDSAYRMTGALVLDDSMRTGLQPDRKETAA